MQSSGWPAVVTCVANWFGKGRLVYYSYINAFFWLLCYVYGYMYQNMAAVMGNLYFFVNKPLSEVVQMCI